MERKCLAKTNRALLDPSRAGVADILNAFASLTDYCGGTRLQILLLCLPGSDVGSGLDLCRIRRDQTSVSSSDQAGKVIGRETQRWHRSYDTFIPQTFLPGI
jgi:hypothetical protein